MSFPSRLDYIRTLQEHGFISDAAGFVADDRLTRAVYLDWLLRPQVGCVFAQLLARPTHRERSGMRMAVARGASGLGHPRELAQQIANLTREAVEDPSSQALSVLLPQVLDDAKLTELAWELGKQPGWSIEREDLWRGTLVLVGIRVRIAATTHAETLGLGPFPIFPRTRQCPVTTLEVRTKPSGAKRSRQQSGYLASHLADITMTLPKEDYRRRRVVFTPWLRKRILGTNDRRAKAGVTYSVPAVMWRELRARDLGNHAP